MIMLHRQLSAPQPMALAGSRGRCALDDELRVKVSELERRFADYKLRIRANRTGPTPRRDEIADADGTCDGDVNGGKEQRSSRGELYGVYMERRDARLRGGWRTRMEEKEARMQAMWESLERSRAEMAARFGRSEKREISESSAEKKTYVLATPRSTPSKRFSFNSIAYSSTPRSSITQVSRPSSSSSYSTKRMIQPESPLAQSVSTVSNPKKKNRTPSTGNNTWNSVPRSRILTRSKSSISNSEGQMAPRSVSSRSETKKGAKSKPFLRRGSGIGAGAAAIAKQRACNVFETTADEEETAEMVDQCDILSDREKDNEEDCTRLSGNDSDGRNLSLSEEWYNDVRPVSENGKANGNNNVEELSGESWRSSWYSNISCSFSSKSGIDNLLDSPVGSPPSLISQSVEQLRQAELTRVRKKWEIAEKPIVAPTNPQSPKDAARGLKRFLKFGIRARISISKFSC